VKSTEGSSDCGAVPCTAVTVPPDFLLELPAELLADDDELDEPPQALTATAATSARQPVSAGLTCLFIAIPPPRALAVADNLCQNGGGMSRYVMAAGGS
jgi:hypothetical protein